LRNILTKYTFWQASRATGVHDQSQVVSGWTSRGFKHYNQNKTQLNM